VAANGTALYSVDFGTRDPLGRIVTKTERIQGETHVYAYTYDTLSRVTDVTKDSVTTSHYEYDANGNRLVGPGLTASPVYDAQDRLLSYGNCSYTYKGDGALKTKTCPDGTTTYDYDTFGNLRSATIANGTSISYLVDGHNRRVGKKVNGALVETFLYGDDLRLVGWYDGAGSLRGQFIYDVYGQSPAYMIKDGQTYKLVRDQIGSVREVVAADGSIAQRLDFDEFGNVLIDSAPGFQPFGFAGGLKDPHTGLTKFGARDYDSVIGRWIAQDPARFRGGLSNLYSYVGGEPVNKADPTGRGPLGFGAFVACAAYEGYSTISDFTELARLADEVEKLGEQLRPLREKCSMPPLFCAPEEFQRLQSLDKLWRAKTAEYVDAQIAAYAKTFAVGCICAGAAGVAFATPF
jgi:RHS repeat-associated protein